jgi:hypothetical protein
MGASISHAARAHDRSVSGRRLDRHSCAHAIAAWSAKVDTNSISLSEKGRTLMISDQQRAPHARDLGKTRPVVKRLIAGEDLRSPLVRRRRFGPGSPARPKAPHQGP